MAQPYPDMQLRLQDGTGRGVRRHVRAQIVRLFAEVRSHDGAEHQHLWIDRLVALDGLVDYAPDVFVAIRVTNGGIGAPIPFVADTPVEMQGMFIAADQADPGPDDPGLAVLHFTHAPVGFVIYDGREYR